jgi:predicted small secreted protein
VTRRSYLAVLLVLAAAPAACNTIVGVEDVRLRGSGSKPSTTTDPNNNGNGTDPGDGTTTPDASTTPDAGAKGCNGEVSCTRYVFLTSATFTGKLGGLSGADATCFTLAQASPILKGRTFRAFLSDGTKSAADRLPHGTKQYIRTDGQTIALQWGGANGIVSGTLQAPIMLDEKGEQPSGTGFALSAWTGSLFDGTASTSTCNNWTSDSVTDNGEFGDSTVSTSDWADLGGGSCNSQKHLYCVEY